MSLLVRERAILTGMSDLKRFDNGGGGYFTQWLLNKQNDFNEWVIIEAWCDIGVQGIEELEVQEVEGWEEEKAIDIKYEVKVWGMKRKKHIREIGY